MFCMRQENPYITSYFNKNKVADDVSVFNKYFMFICNPDRETL